MSNEKLFNQKPLEVMARFWDSTAEWRISYFDDLAQTPDVNLPWALRCEREFVICEHVVIDRLVTEASNILELGCGVGRSIISSIRQYAEKRFLGVDVSQRQLQLFQQRVRQEGRPNAQAILADVKELPISDRSIDLVLICNQTFGNFLGETRISCMRETARVLRKDGLLMIGGFTNKTLIEPCYRAWNVAMESVDLESGFVELASYNTWWQDYASLTSFISSFGFKQVSSDKIEIGFIDVFRRS